MHRTLLAIAVTVAAVACGSPGDDNTASSGNTESSGSDVPNDDGPLAARTFTYEVAYGDPSISAQADITFTDANGDETTATVSMPWESDAISVAEGQSYRLVATAAPRDDTTLRCGVNTDNGWSLGSSDPIGECSYVFPDELVDDEP